MRITTYAYPWDLGRLGVAATLDEIAEQGIEGVYLASSYHPIDALSPREDAPRVFSDARGAVHFPARRARYARIQPSLSPPEICGVWPEAAERARSLGVALSAWTVTLYQPWIVDNYPDTARVLPGGDAVRSGVCPANEDVRDYVATLCADLVDQFGVNTIHLEGVMPRSYDFDWLRPRVLVDISPLAGELLGICFCATCTRRATTAGLDVDRLRKLVNETIASEIADGTAAAEVDRAAALAADDELRAFVVQHEQASLELTRIAATRFEGAPRPRMSSTTWTPFTSLLGAAENAILEELVEVVDQVVVQPGVFVERAQRLAAIASRSTRPVEIAMLISQLRPGAVTASARTAPASEPLVVQLQEAADLGAAEFGVYNYGLLRERDVRDFLAAARAVSS